MPEADNITEFKHALLKVIAHAYSQFPKPVTVKTDLMSEDGIKWLQSAGILEGQTGGGLNDFFLWNATLTRSSLSALQATEPNSGVPNETLGQLVARTVAGNDDREMRVVADLLGRRLLSI